MEERAGDVLVDDGGEVLVEEGDALGNTFALFALLDGSATFEVQIIRKNINPKLFFIPYL